MWNFCLQFLTATCWYVDYSYLFWGFGSIKEASGIGYTTYMGKPKIPIGKSNGSRYSFGEAHRKIKGVIMTPKNRVKILGTE